MANPSLFHSLSVELPTHQYPIYIGKYLFADTQLLMRHVLAEQVLVVTNDTIAPLYLEAIQQAFAALQCNVVVLPDGEEHKNQHQLFAIYDALIRHRHHRDTTLVALGGGVIGDITGFAAATYQRGVGFIQLPTTLLAQVDASIGGKTAINHPLAKNMIGSFYQPQAVIMDVHTLTSLPDREFRAGLAEVIKYGLLAGGSFLSTLQSMLDSELTSSCFQSLAMLISECCHIKADYVTADERDTGRRVLLNLGHTFAHALEAYTHYQRWLHGEAVAIGLYCAALLSYQLGYLTSIHLAVVESLLIAAKLPCRIPRDINLLELRALMQHDKKVKNKSLPFVLLRAPGDCYLETHVSESCLKQVLSDAVEL